MRSRLVGNRMQFDKQRRDFITLLGGTAVMWPLAARAQQPNRMRRIGVLMPFAETDPEASQHIATFQKGLENLGWLEGHNLHIDYRWAAGDAERMRIYAAEIVQLAPEVILVSSPSMLAATVRRLAPSQSYSCRSQIPSPAASSRVWPIRAATSPGSLVSRTR
jgi:hypothetical protein